MSDQAAASDSMLYRECLSPVFLRSIVTDLTRMLCVTLSMLCHAVRRCAMSQYAMDWTQQDFVLYLVVEPLADGAAGETLRRQLPHLGVLRVTLLWHTSHHLTLQIPHSVSSADSRWP